MLTWNTKKSKFVEADGTEHSKDRCEALKKGSSSNFHNGKQDSQSSSNNHNISDYARMRAENMEGNRALIQTISGLTNAINNLAKGVKN